MVDRQVKPLPIPTSLIPWRGVRLPLEQKALKLDHEHFTQVRVVPCWPGQARRFDELLSTGILKSRGGCVCVCGMPPGGGVDWITSWLEHPIRYWFDTLQYSDSLFSPGRKYLGYLVKLQIIQVLGVSVSQFRLLKIFIGFRKYRGLSLTIKNFNSLSSSYPSIICIVHDSPIRMDILVLLMYFLIPVLLFVSLWAMSSPQSCLYNKNRLSSSSHSFHHLLGRSQI